MSTITQMRADASTLSTNAAFADLTTSIGTKVGWQGGKLILAMISEWIARKWFPFRPETVKVSLTENPLLFDPPGLARLTFQLTVESFAEWEFTATALQYELLIGGQPLFTLDKPLSFKLKPYHRDSIYVQAFLTPGLVVAVHDAMCGALESTSCELRVKLPMLHVLGEHLLSQHYQTNFRVMARQP